MGAVSSEETAKNTPLDREIDYALQSVRLVASGGGAARMFSGYHTPDVVGIDVVMPMDANASNEFQIAIQAPHEDHIRFYDAEGAGVCAFLVDLRRLGGGGDGGTDPVGLVVHRYAADGPTAITSRAWTRQDVACLELQLTPTFRHRTPTAPPPTPYPGGAFFDYGPGDGGHRTLLHRRDHAADTTKKVARIHGRPHAGSPVMKFRFHLHADMSTMRAATAAREADEAMWCRI